MRNGFKIAAIIPALNEERSIGKVITAIPGWVDDIIVVDNGSTDRTRDVAERYGARVAVQPRRGYGAACLTGMAALENPDVVVFLDGDFSDHPEEMGRLVDPILAGQADMVIGSRMLGRQAPGALAPHARLGNKLACLLIRLFWQTRYTDLGPFRAIRASTLRGLDMRDADYGWTVEMQVKAAQKGISVMDVPVSYRRRIGKSKVSGTVRGVLGAGVKIIFTILWAAARSLLRRQPEGDKVILFTRYPEPGRTKTRLIPALGPEGAADLQRQMTEHMLARLHQLRRHQSISIQVRYEGGSHAQMSRWLGAKLSYQPQGDGDLGTRLAHAFQDAFDTGRRRVVIIGSDCPGLSVELLRAAFKALDQHDVVLGPAHDGGYYLIGLRRPIPELFARVSWGTEAVLEQTKRKLDRLSVAARFLDPLGDVDRPEDISIWERESGCHLQESTPLRLSVIVPALNEASNISRALSSAKTAPDIELIVVDGGSEDATVEIARSLGARVITSSAGRARQMNAGAAAATGDVLLFLHADTVLPPRFDRYVREILGHPEAAAGAFQLGIDSPEPGLRIIERLANWRSTHMNMPYGDQAIFLKARLFHAIGGFSDLPIMEDVDLIRRVRRHGRIMTARARVATSGRRWTKVGVLRATLLNQAVIAAYWLRISPTRLARWYYPDRERLVSRRDTHHLPTDHHLKARSSPPPHP